MVLRIVNFAQKKDKGKGKGKGKDLTFKDKDRHKVWIHKEQDNDL